MPKAHPLPRATLPATLHRHDRNLEALARQAPRSPSAGLPANPVLGQQAVLNHASGHWLLVWTGSAWSYLGGADLSVYAASEVSYGSNTYPASPQGPSVTIPRGGTYDVWLEARFRHSHTGILFTAASIGPTGSSNAALVGAERAPVIAPGAQPWQGWWSQGVSLSAGQLHLWFRAPNGGGLMTHYAYRVLRVRPVTLV